MTWDENIIMDELKSTCKQLNQNCVKEPLVCIVGWDHILYENYNFLETPEFACDLLFDQN